MSDILDDWHPMAIAGMIRHATRDQPQKAAAFILGITPQYLCDIVKGRRNLSPEVAAKLHRFGLDGRYLYVMQEKRRVEIQWRYETGAIERPPDFTVNEENPIKPRLRSKANAYRQGAKKAARSRKMMKLGRDACGP